jgi:hypothetical protein
MPNVIVIDRALPPDKCLWPNFMIEALAFLLLGITFGVFYIVIAEVFDDRIRNRSDLDNLFGSNVLGYVKSINRYTIESGMVGLCAKINNEMKNHNINNVNVVSWVVVDMLPFIIDGFISLGTSTLVLTDRLIIFPNKCIAYKEVDGKIGHIASINERSAVLSLGISGHNFSEKVFEYLHGVKNKYDRVIIGFNDGKNSCLCNLLGDELMLFMVKYNSTKTADILQSVDNSFVSREKIYSIVLF